VPAGSTGKFQPADLSLQRVFKYIICHEFNAFLAQKVKEHLVNGSNSSTFKLNTGLGYLRDLTPVFLAKSYTYMLENLDLIDRSWSKAVAQAPNDDCQQINLLDAWKHDVQEVALQMFAAGTLFPNQQQNTADEPEDLMGEAAIDDGDEVPLDDLVNVLVQDGNHPAVNHGDSEEHMQVEEG